ncbi:MAG: arylsulfatase, partial [Planctomycetes bacterium]|nr:arylsulfatase [Planctomycetota bacterium]
DRHIKQYYLYIDYPGQMDELMKLPGDAQADVFTKVIGPAEKQEGFTFVYPVLFDKWDANKQFTSKDGKYKGASMYEVIRQSINPSHGKLYEADKPNIVFILADDLGYGDIRCYNPGGKVPTPNLDSLGEQGIRFTDAHSGAAVCSPSRYGLLTGRHFLRRPNWIEGMLSKCLIDEEQLTVGEYLQQYGYHTACFGKWHLGQTWFDPAGEPVGPTFKTDYSRPTRGGPNDQGFDLFFGMNGTAVGAPQSMMENRLVIEVPTEKAEKKGRPMARSHRPVDVMVRTTQRVLQYIDESATKRSGQPFFIYYAMTAIHTPIVPAEQYKGRSQASDYGDFVYQVDDNVGQIMRKLKENGLAENTLLIFSSDNGSHGRASEEQGNGPGSVIKKFGHKANGNWRGLKGDGFEGGHRVPFIARWPSRIEADSVCDKLITLEDFMATCAAILDEDLPENTAEDSYNILGYLENTHTGKPIRDYAVLSTFYGKPIIRRGKWVLMPFLEAGGPYGQPKEAEPVPGGPLGQLYDLKADPRQKNNLWLSHPEVVLELMTLYDKHMALGHSLH